MPQQCNVVFECNAMKSDQYSIHTFLLFFTSDMNFGNIIQLFKNHWPEIRYEQCEWHSIGFCKANIVTITTHFTNMAATLRNTYLRISMEISFALNWSSYPLCVSFSLCVCVCGNYELQESFVVFWIYEVIKI